MYIDTEAASSITSTDHLSPPSTISRFSDSDISEFDLEDNLIKGEHSCSVLFGCWLDYLALSWQIRLSL